MKRIRLLCVALAVMLAVGLSVGAPLGTAHAQAAVTQQAAHPQMPMCIPDPNGSGCATQCQLYHNTQYCNGQDPVATKCSEDATTAGSILLKDPSGNSVGLIEMRWSNTCQTNWTRTTTYLPYSWVMTLTAKIVCGYESTSPCGSTKSYQNTCNPSWGPGSGSGYCLSQGTNYAEWSPMIYAPDSVESCGEIDDAVRGYDFYGGWANPGYVSGSASCKTGEQTISLP